MKNIKFQASMKDGSTMEFNGKEFEYRGERFAYDKRNAITHIESGVLVWHEEHNTPEIIYTMEECIAIFKEKIDKTSEATFKAGVEDCMAKSALSR